MPKQFGLLIFIISLVLAELCSASNLNPKVGSNIPRLMPKLVRALEEEDLEESKRLALLIE